MNFRYVRCLRGPNVWASCPVFEAALDLSEGLSWSSEDVRKTIARLEAAFPDTKFETASEDDSPLMVLARAFGLAALKLQCLAGNAVSFTAARVTSDSGVILTAFEFAEETVGQPAMDTALRLLQSAREGSPLALEEDLRCLRGLAYKQRLPVSTAVIYHAARARGIPATRLHPEYQRFLRLGQGSKLHLCQASETDDITTLGRILSTDKYLAKHLLRAAGVPVPEGRLVSMAEEAWAAASALGLPVAIKPLDTDLATGVSLDLKSREQVEAGFHFAREHSSEVLVERFAPGMEHRVLVVADRVVAVARIEPPNVVGDGVSTVAELVERVNKDPRRGDEDSGAPLNKIKTDDVAQAVLAGQGQTLDSIPPAGIRVLLRRNPPYIKNGGNLADLTDRIHPSTIAHAVAAAQALQLRVAGLDVVAVDIARPLEEQNGVVVEINAGPGLWLHMAPWADSPRPIGEAIVASMYPLGSDGRIPVVAILGDTTGCAKKHLMSLLAFAGLRAGVAGEAEVVVADRHWEASLRTPQERASLLMQNSSVDVALLETNPRELIGAGFGNDRCDVALVLDSTVSGAEGDGIGLAPSEFAHALRHALASEGVFVLPAEGAAASIDASAPANRTILVAVQGQAPRLSAHLAAAGRVLMVQGEYLVLAQGTEAPIVLGKCLEGMTEEKLPALLAALAAGLVLDLSLETLKRYLCSMP